MYFNYSKNVSQKQWCFFGLKIDRSLITVVIFWQGIRAKHPPLCEARTKVRGVRRKGWGEDRRDKRGQSAFGARCHIVYGTSCFIGRSVPAHDGHTPCRAGPCPFPTFWRVSNFLWQKASQSLCQSTNREKKVDNFLCVLLQTRWGWRRSIHAAKLKPSLSRRPWRRRRLPRLGPRRRLER